MDASVGAPHEISYWATKHMLESLSRSAALELAPLGSPSTPFVPGRRRRAGSRPRGRSTSCPKCHWAGSGRRRTWRTWSSSSAPTSTLADGPDSLRGRWSPPILTP
jgi:NAD(P)-dependent dehydrogenase (short-subunit alcohol dehydrogenase family)